MTGCWEDEAVEQGRLGQNLKGGEQIEGFMEFCGEYTLDSL